MPSAEEATEVQCEVGELVATHDPAVAGEKIKIGPGPVGNDVYPIVAANFIPSADEARAVQPVHEASGATVSVQLSPEFVEMRMPP